MTDEVNLESVEQEQVPVVDQPVQEKMLPQSQVGKIVSREVRDAREKAAAAHQAELQKLREEFAQKSSMGGMTQSSPDDIRRMIEEVAGQAAHKKMQEQYDHQLEQLRLEQGNRIASEFVQKMELGKSKYPDFDEVVGNVDFTTIPQIVHLTHSMDNAADVVYDLMKNPHKVAHVLTLSERNELLAKRAIQDLSNSIKINDKAQRTASVNEPLSQVSPSTIGLDNSPMTVDDYRAQPWLRV